MKTFNVDVKVYATAYIQANNYAEAVLIAGELTAATLYLDVEQTDVVVYGGILEDAPRLSLSPVATIAGLSGEMSEVH